MERDGEEISASSHWILPSKEFSDLWENLYYNPDVKENVNTILLLLLITFILINIPC